jgi:hypothetical protein
MWLCPEFFALSVRKLWLILRFVGEEWPAGHSSRGLPTAACTSRFMFRRRLVPSMRPPHTAAVLQPTQAGVQFFVSDKCLGLIEDPAEFYPEARWQRCVPCGGRGAVRLLPADAPLRSDRSWQRAGAGLRASEISAGPQWRFPTQNNKLVRRRDKITGNGAYTKSQTRDKHATGDDVCIDITLSRFSPSLDLPPEPAMTPLSDFPLRNEELGR